MTARYKRQEVDPGIFKNFLPEGVKLVIQPELPKVEFKKNGVKYSMTDFRLLHPYGKYAFEICLKTMLNIHGAEECEVGFDREFITDDEIEITKDIVMGFEYHAKKGGRNGFEMGSRIITGVRTKEQKQKSITTVVFEFQQDFANCAYEYKHKQDDEEIRLADLVVYASEQFMQTKEYFATCQKILSDRP